MYSKRGGLWDAGKTGAAAGHCRRHQLGAGGPPSAGPGEPLPGGRGHHRRPRRLHPGGHGGDWLPAAAVSEEVKPMGRCFDFPAVSLHLIDKSEKNAYNIIAGKIALYTRVTELTFKCHVLAPATGKPPKGGFFF